MDKFKVGDKVKLVSMKNEDSFYKKYLGKIFTIKQVGCVAVTFKEATEENISPYYYNLQKVEEEYTYEDLKKSPIGTKVTFENEKTFFKIANSLLGDGYKYQIVNPSSFNSVLNGKIIKIEEPIYQTVYECKEEILDEAEKRYLRGVIRPFRDKVKYIAKYHSTTICEECILIYISNNPNIMLPYFKEDSMYKGMESGKEYTLKELGL